jgi:hypothetical protein
MEGGIVDQGLRQLPERLLGPCPQPVLLVFLEAQVTAA